ncbi:MAG TPA: tetraacyldisaccharide 4'-kinase [Catalimonadaceae bacterium]|nr:tetraacyldisaccharide 4'-kinase [Catalimonadaceae bacterium]
MANVFRIIFFSPLAWLYGGILRLRHRLYDSNRKERFESPVTTVGIGNLELGGSGKTPMADFLISHFSKKLPVAYLSRGYKRISEGFQLAGPTSTVTELGDEAYQIFSRWKSNLTVAVDSDRKNGILEILRRKPETRLILLDDAMQHLRVKPTLNILLTPASRPFFRNYLVPAGSLRDITEAYKKADLVVFTKSAQANDETLRSLQIIWKQNQLEPKPLFVSSLVYKTAVNKDGTVLSSNEPVFCVAGLASNLLFFEHCLKNFSVKKCLSKPDHYRYLGDFFQTESLAESTVLTTEKDFQKLLNIAPHPEKIFYLPIEIQIHPEADFLATIEKGI